VTEYTINTILKSIVELDWFLYERNMTSEEISSILIPDFETTFGEQDKVLIKIKQTPIEN
jgi:hypothetical protein